MSWANQQEVLRVFRMLTEREAFLRRLALSCSIGLIVSLFTFRLAWSVRLFIFSILSAFYYIASDSLYKSIFKSLSSFSKHKPVDSLNGLGDMENLSKGEGPVFVLADPYAKESGLHKAFSNPLIERITRLVCATSAAAISAHIILSMYKSALSVSLFILASSAAYILCDYLIGVIESREFTEFPTAFKDRIMLRFHCHFACSRGYYFIGEVNGHRFGLPRLLRFLHTLIGGPTGEGKSSSLIILPLLFDADSPGSALAPDAKSPELFYWVAGRWIKKGKKVVLFDPWHPDCAGVNPIPGADDQELQAIVETVLKEKEEVLKEESFFKSRTKYLLYAVLKLVQSWDDEFCNLPAVYRAVESVETLDNLIAGADTDVKRLFDDFGLLGGEAKVNALTSIRDKLDIFMDKDVRKAFSKADFKLEMLFNEKDPCLLIIGAPIDKKQQGSRIASLIANLVTNMAFKERRLLKQAIQRGQKSFIPNDLYLYADELRNLKIAQLPDLVSIAREIKMHVICSVTDLDFLRYYGRDFGALMGNLRSKIFLGGLDHDSCEYISKSLGKKEVITYGLVRDDAISRTEQRLVMEPAEVHNLDKKKLLVFTSETKPFIADRVSVYDCDWAKKMHVPPPKEMKPYYEKWGFYSGPLTDTVLPRRGEHFDMKKLKGNKPEARIEKSLSLKDFEDRFEERGGGKYRRTQEQESAESNINHDDEENSIAGIY